MTVLKTDTNAFPPLPDFPFEENYYPLQDADFGTLQMHYIDEGPRDAPIVLMLHGEPSWCFSWRKLVSLLLAAGFRAIAPDHIGFGKSDKLARREHYSYAKHKEWMAQLVNGLDLVNVTLVCQDWGGPIGLSTLAACEHRFSAVVASNTLLPNNEPPPNGIDDWPGDIVTNWVSVVEQANDLAVADIVAGVSVTALSEEVRAAYDAPFPDATHKAGVLSFPVLIPINDNMAGSDENREVWEFLERWHKPFLTAFSDSDPSTLPWAEVFQRRIPGARELKHPIIEGAGHFVQEEQGERLAETVIALLQETQK